MGYNMPPKSKKTVEKAKKKTVEDKTFGLKNKKGAKQQKYIEQVNKQVYNKNPGEARQQAQKVSAKAKKAAYLEELDAIMKPMKQDRKVIMSKKQEQQDKDKEVVYLTIEELVEVERIKLKNSGKKLTPVTLESFLIWKRNKKAEQKKKEIAEAKQKQKYQKEGKIVTSTGKELFAYYHTHDNTLMNDDEDAASAADYDDSDDDQMVALKEQGGVREITAETFYYD